MLVGRLRRQRQERRCDDVTVARKLYAGFDPPAPLKATCAHRLGWQRLANQIARRRLLPGLAARPAHRADRRAVEQHQRGQPRPQLPRELHLAGHRHARTSAASSTSSCAATRAHEDPDLPRRAQRRRRTPCFAEPERAGERERDQRDALHGQPGRRRLAPPAALAAQGRPLHRLRAPRAPARLPQGGRVPQARARLARADRALARRREPDPRESFSPAPRPGRSARPASTSSSTGSPARAARPAAVASRAARAAPARGSPGRRPGGGRGARAAAPPRGRDRAGSTWAARDLRDAQATLEQVLAGLDARLPGRPRPGSASPSPGAFRTSTASSPPRPAAYLPYDRRAGKPALLDARRFPSDPVDTVLEANDVAILLRSDQRAHIDDALARLEHERRSCGSRACAAASSAARSTAATRCRAQMAIAADVPGAELIPEGSELFLGFTSTQQAAFGPGKIANFETLGYVDLRGSDYFREGTHMHLSPPHRGPRGVVRQLPLRRAGRDRVPARASRVAANTQTVAQGPEQASTAAEVRRALTARPAGSATAPRSRRPRGSRGDAVGADGTRYPKGTAVPIRADFNTLDNPFLYSDAPNVIQPAPIGGHPLPRLQPLERRLRPQPARDGRRAPGRRPRRSRRALARAGVQLDPDDDASPELPRAAAPPPELPARRALSRRGAGARRLAASSGGRRSRGRRGRRSGRRGRSRRQAAAPS